MAWPADTGAGRVAPRSPAPTATTSPIWSNDGSRPAPRTWRGAKTSPTSPPGRAGCTWPRVLDLGSRRLLGYSMADHMRTELVLNALTMAVGARGGDHAVAGVIAHADRGSQGGFRWSSQHLEMEVVRDGVQASAGGGDPGDAGEDVVAWAAFDGATRGSGSVLGGNRPRIVDRRCRRAGRRVIRGRGAVVPGVWRDAVTHVGPGVGRFLVLR